MHNIYNILSYTYYIIRSTVQVLFDEVMLKMTEGDVAMLQQIGADVIYQTAKRNLAFRVHF